MVDSIEVGKLYDTNLGRNPDVVCVEEIVRFSAGTMMVKYFRIGKPEKKEFSTLLDSRTYWGKVL